MTDIDSFSQAIWNDLRRRGFKTPKEEEAAHKRYAEWKKQHTKERWPICCKFWNGLHIQKDVRKLVGRITRQNEAYSEKLHYCPECGRKLDVS